MPLSQMSQTELVAQPEDVTECPYKSKAFASAQTDNQVTL